MRTRANKPENKNQNTSPFFSGQNSNGFLNVQAKLTVGEPEDAYEKEAAQVADKVVGQAPSESQRFFDPSNSSLVQCRPEVTIQEKPLAETITPVMLKEKEKDRNLNTKVV